MRYPQIFATKAIESKLKSGTRKGIIWHTQGSGKTALAFYNVHFLTDYYQKRGVVPKFYFIVDRIDLMEQASKEFRSRGLEVRTIDSREEFKVEIKSNLAVHNPLGQPEITVVNIHRFADEPNLLQNTDYSLDLQRVYFLDEVHRSYNPTGSFLANLHQSDPKAIWIGLTGTPLLKGTIQGGDAGNKQNYNSRVIFGDYIHKYFYNRSIADGYTLRLIREDIETKYNLQLRETLEQIKVLKNIKGRTMVYSHPRFVEPMLDYIVADLEKLRVMKNDRSVGAMVICDSSEQAKEMARIFAEKFADKPPKLHLEQSNHQFQAVAEEPKVVYRTDDKTVTTAALILHDVGTKADRKDQVEAFKNGKIDILFVFNMLLTGFDSNRLKKLYLGRVIKAHNLLQALTRVNRPYKGFRYGYVVDFVDIEAEFDKTNKDYFDELQTELGDEIESYSNLFKTQAEIAAEIEAIKDALFQFDTTDSEIFSQQISQITDRVVMRTIVKALNDAKSLYNLIRLSGNYELLDKLDFRKLNELSIEAGNHLTLLNQREAIENADDSLNILNIALEDVLFTFRKVSEAEMVIADELRDVLRRTREGLGGNFDPADPRFVTLREELERLFKHKDLAEITQEEMSENIVKLKSIQTRAQELERTNKLILAKYNNDEKYARIHKRLLEKKDPTDNERKLFEALSAFKADVDALFVQNSRMLTNEPFAKAAISPLIINQLQNKHQLNMTPQNVEFIKTLVMKEYLADFNGHYVR